jgi:hypothetical protein
VERLERHPELYERFKGLLQMVENEAGEALTADEAEERVVEEIRRLGHEALQAWAIRRTDRTALREPPPRAAAQR